MSAKSAVHVSRAAPHTARKSLWGLGRIWHAARFCQQHARSLLPLYAFDVLGLLLFSFGSSMLMQRLMDVLVSLNALSGEFGQAGTLPAGVAQEQFMGQYALLLKLALMMIGLSYLLWTAVFGSGLWRTYAIAGRNVSLANFLARFAVVNLAALFAAFLCSWTYVAIQARGTVLGNTPAAVGFALLMTAVLYLTFCAYQRLELPLAQLGQAIMGAAADVRHHLLPFLALFLLSVVLWELLTWATTAGVLIGILAMLILLPFATLARAVLATHHDR